ncbi:MAG: cytochrome bc complex cytochrome b subunit [bacterium]|nr:cytochrome bc complex cytochrome b subunit [bacterium]
MRRFIFRASTRRTEKEDKRAGFTSFILHLHPAKIPEKTLKLTHTWGLGGMAALLVTIQIVTGTLLRFVYEPFPERAYDSILTLQQDVLFGQFIHNIHHWSGTILVIVVFLHLLRVFFTGAFHHPRRFNWIIGLCLFFFVLLSNFSGYLLPWDQLAYWAITISTSMLEYVPVIGIELQKTIRGGSEVGSATLLNFFTFHTAILPGCLLIFMAFHFWRVRKAKGVVIPQTPGEEPDTANRYVPTIPNLVLRELVVALVLIACILVFSLIFDASLGEKANPGLSPNPTKAPWYFMGIQEMLLHVHPLFAVFLIPLFVSGACMLLPYLPYDSRRTGVWFFSQKGRRMAIVSVAAAIVMVPLAIICDEFFIDFTTWMPGVPVVLSNGVLPVGMILAATIGFYIFMKRRYSASNNEAIQAVFILLLVSFIIFTVTGIWFRGPGMALVWPWSIAA